MEGQTLQQKFRKELDVLKQAANKEFLLDVKKPKLYKKIRKFYENAGVVFSNDDPLDNYDILIDCLYEDVVLFAEVDES